MRIRSLALQHGADQKVVNTLNWRHSDEHEDKCYGVAKAGKNDCAANGHSCAGQAKTDNDPNEWKHMSKDDCAKAGGKTEAPSK